jgi:hypothetical protein
MAVVCNINQNEEPDGLILRRRGRRIRASSWDGTNSKVVAHGVVHLLEQVVRAEMKRFTREIAGKRVS